MTSLFVSFDCDSLSEECRKKGSFALWRNLVIGNYGRA